MVRLDRNTLECSTCAKERLGQVYKYSDISSLLGSLACPWYTYAGKEKHHEHPPLPHSFTHSLNQSILSPPNRNYEPYHLIDMGTNPPPPPPPPPPYRIWTITNSITHRDRAPKEKPTSVVQVRNVAFPKPSPHATNSQCPHHWRRRSGSRRMLSHRCLIHMRRWGIEVVFRCRRGGGAIKS